MKFRWLFTTVPHSGTRYFNTSAQNAGASIAAYYIRTIREALDEPRYIWGHFVSKHYRDLQEVAANSEFKLVALRDPLHVLGSHWQDVHSAKRDWEWQVGEKKGRLESFWTYQNKYVEEFNPTIFPIERTDLPNLGETIGLKLKPHERRFSNKYPLKQAILDKNDKLINQLMPNSGMWEWFVNDATPIFSSLYEAHGYDLWWK